VIFLVISSVLKSSLWRLSIFDLPPNALFNENLIIQTSRKIRKMNFV